MKGSSPVHVCLSVKCHSHQGQAHWVSFCPLLCLIWFGGCLAQTQKQLLLVLVPYQLHGFSIGGGPPRRKHKQKSHPAQGGTTCMEFIRVAYHKVLFSIQLGDFGVITVQWFPPRMAEFWSRYDLCSALGLRCFFASS